MIVGVEQRAAQGGALGAGEVSRLLGPGEHRVLQADQHLAVLDRRHQHVQPIGHVGRQAGAQGPAHQFGGQHHAPLAERIQRQGTFGGFDAQQEVAGKVDAFDRQAAAARGVEIEDPERHRDAAPALGHLDHVGVGRVVPGQKVAIEAEVAGQGLGDRLLGGFRLQPAAQSLGDLFAEGAGGPRIALGRFVHGAGQGCFQQGEAPILGLASLRQHPLRVFARHPSVVLG